MPACLKRSSWSTDHSTSPAGWWRVAVVEDVGLADVARRLHVVGMVRELLGILNEDLEVGVSSRFAGVGREILDEVHDVGFGGGVVRGAGPSGLLGLVGVHDVEVDAVVAGSEGLVQVSWIIPWQEAGSQ